jgi:amino acid transporter
MSTQESNSSLHMRHASRQPIVTFILAADTMSFAMGITGLLEGWTRAVSLFAVSILLAYLNYRGLTIVGRVAIAMTLFIVVTFLVLIALALPHLQPRNWLVVDMDTVEWRPFINVMFWCAAAP